MYDRVDPKCVGSWRYRVVVDGKILLETKPLSESRNGEVEISVTLPSGAKELSLIADSLGNRDCDWAVWAYPRLQK